jgi:hypothetical protein
MTRTYTNIAMSVSNRERRRCFFRSGYASVFIIIALTLLAGSGFILITSITPTTAALAQGENNNTKATSTIGNNTTISTTTASSGIELSPQPVYQEHVRDVSETLINQTHAQLVVEGNGTLILPNGTETIRTTSTGSGIVSIIGTFVGKEILTTEDGSERATATSYEIARSNKAEGIGKGIAVAIIHTNSTGRLAPLDGMILVGLEEIQPDGRPLLTFWEWQSGIPTTTTTNIEEPELMNTTTTTTNAAADTNASAALTTAAVISNTTNASSSGIELSQQNLSTKNRQEL